MGGLSYFVDTKLLFIIFSVIAGAGFGFVLGAPLTVLTSYAAGTQKGSAIGTLSVARQLGLTISQTSFAAFIQSGFSKISTIIPQKLNEHGIDESQLPEGALDELAGSSYGDLQAKIDNIPSPEVRDALHEAFQQAAHSAYAPIYLTIAIMAFLIIVISVVFRNQFKQDEIDSDALDEQEESATTKDY